MAYSIKIHNSAEFEKMRAAGKLASQTLDHVEKFIKPGITTLELNDICHDFIIKNNAIPAPLNYRGFPKSVCTSVNHVVCHGVPNQSTVLMDGYIINIDVTVILNGWHGDTSRTFMVGDSFQKNNGRIKKIKKLVADAHEAMMVGIRQAIPGNNFSDIGIAVDKFAKSKGYSSVKEYCGHGIGQTFHADPHVIHYDPTYDPYFEDAVIKPGMFFTVEPMMNLGTAETVLSNLDNWTVYTKDHKLSAQFEHTIGITENGYEIFTKS